MHLLEALEQAMSSVDVLIRIQLGFDISSFWQKYVFCLCEIWFVIYTQFYTQH